MRPFLFLATCFIATASLAAPANPTAGEQSDVKRIEQYLSGLTTLAADFTQTAGDGSVSKGKFYLQRPGKMRWQYELPTPILLVSDGKVVTYYDAELDQTSYIDTDETLAAFLMQKDVSFDSPTTKLTRMETLPDGALRATLVQKAKPQEGSLTLEFSDKPLALKQMLITDATGQTSRVVLTNAHYGAPLDKKLFVFEAPKKNRNR